MHSPYVAARGAGWALVSATGLLALDGALLAACGVPATDVSPGAPTGYVAGPGAGPSDGATATEAATSGLQISLHPGGIGGIAPPGELLRLRLEDDAGARAEARLRPQGAGAFLTWLRDEAGRRVRPAPGQRISSSEHGALEIPELNGRWDLANGALEGEETRRIRHLLHPRAKRPRALAGARVPLAQVGCKRICPRSSKSHKPRQVCRGSAQAWRSIERPAATRRGGREPTRPTERPRTAASRNREECEDRP